MGPLLFVLLYVGEVLRDNFQYEKENAETSLFKRCYSEACAVAALIDIQPIMSRIASWKLFPANAESNTPFQYHLTNVCYPLLNHLIQGIDNRFGKYGSPVYLMPGLTSSVIVVRDITVKYIIDKYQDDKSISTIALSLQP